MEINRSNYEIWLIDLLDGNLSKIQADMVRHFLDRNPDINEEFNQMKGLVAETAQGVYKNKEKLKNSPDNIPESQFELLCASFYEGDLHGESKEELLKIIDSNNGRRKTFELFGRAKLVPVPVVYKNKQLLKRTTPFQWVIRFSVIGLSTAAAIVLFAALPFLTKRDINYNLQNSALVFPLNPGHNDKYFEILSGSIIRKNHTGKTQFVNKLKPDHDYIAVVSAPDSITAVDEKTVTEGFKVSSIPVSMINLTADAGIQKYESSALLSASPELVVPVEDTDMSNVERFVAKVFREKILREKPTRETPLKGYEIAEAGVAGLNKLLGWEMALNERNDENGELKSIYFSSKILKFNTPVKKNQTEQ
jgi:hypothetical protein